MSQQTFLNELQRLNVVNSDSFTIDLPKNNIPSLPSASKSIIAAGLKMPVPECYKPPASYDYQQIKYQDDAHFYPVVYVTGHASIIYPEAYEVARFVVGHREVGIVRGIWQYLMIEGTPSAVNTAAPWDPCWADYINVAPDQMDLRWHLIMSQSPRRAYWNGNYIGTPGVPNTELPVLKSVRFPWGCPPNMFLIIPSGFTLRLVVETRNNGTQPDRVGGRIWGYTQPEHTATALHNVRHGWT